MRRIREVLRLQQAWGNNMSAIASAVGLARSTVRDHLRRAKEAGLNAEQALGMDDAALEAALFPPKGKRGRPTPDWQAVDAELRRHKHVTRKLLWLEYKAEHPDGYNFSQFNLLLRQWQKSSGRGLSFRQVHRAGETVQVDYAGDTVTVLDAGTPRSAQIFVACLPCSGLIYADASWTQGQEDWLRSHVRLFTFLGGMPAKITPDNLKVGVTHASFFDPVINVSYNALAKHYGTAVVPARVGKPKDKPSVENGVLQACRWILAPLRHQQFLSLAELNAAIAEQLCQLNDKPLSPPREGSRRSLFEAVERPALKPLPSEPYLVGHWKIGCRVNVDYHVAIEHNYYSVPYRLVHKMVDAFLTPTTVQLTHRSERVAAHARARGKNVWVTAPEHMPPAHTAVANQTPERMREEAAKIGLATAAYVERLLTSRDHIQQGVRSCLGILRLARQYSPDQLERACRWALAAGACSSGYVEQLLKSRRPIPDPDDSQQTGPGDHANVRGPGYYN
ncbi:MAG: IS21 family transposase [Alphaproteobacteria bacterium]|nr:IS21 family transposase [Alphaproteobacteria bacterium]